LTNTDEFPLALLKEMLYIDYALPSTEEILQIQAELHESEWRNLKNWK
jgi:hypothetical protein